MTYLTQLPSVFKDFDKYFVGFDDSYNKLTKLHDDITKHIPNYPPYNIRKVDSNKYVIELAIAGFSTQDVEITLEDNKLIISGKAQDDNENFLFKGIANRAFTRTFAIDDNIEINDAAMLNGMLRIALERIIPEHKKPKKIEVKEASKSSKKEFLAEDR